MDDSRKRLGTTTHFVDINVPEALQEQEKDEEEDDDELRNQNNNGSKKKKSKVREGKKPPNSRRAAAEGFRRQVSLETGFSVLNADNDDGGGGGEESSRKVGRKFLARNGKSLGGYGISEERNPVVVEVGGGGGRRSDFNMFRTKSTLSRQSSALHRKLESGMIESSQKIDSHGGGGAGGGGGGGGGGGEESMKRSVPAGRYFAALRGPELDEVKDFEDILLPKDEVWPFLLRFPIGCYGMCLGLSSQAILWRALSTSKSTKFLHVSPLINLVIWVVALCVLIAISITYAMKCALYFEAVRREYYHPVRVNFFFAPWVVCMFLAIGVPTSIEPDTTLHPAIWCVFMTPILCLELKIYGQWLSGGKRRLCQVANPSSHLSVIGNFVGAILAAKVGWKEPGKFLWAVGFAHYLVVFVTLYQRLPTSEALPKELHPVYSMFIATPAAASIAWGTLYGDFDGLSRTCYFIALFLYVSLVVRINFFRGFRFSVAWWSYTFPMTTISIATIKYAEHVPSVITKVLALSLSFMSTTMVSILFVFTFLHAFVWQTLFPNDLAIAITKKRQGKEKKFSNKMSDVKRWTKQAPLSFNSSTRKRNSSDKDSDAEK